MTPHGWLTEDLAAAGVVWLFGGALLGAALGLAVGMARSTLQGLGSGLLLWGLGNVLVSAGVLAYLQHDSVELALPPLRCEALGDGAGMALHRIVLRAQRPGEPAHEVRHQLREGPCPELLGDPVRLRLRHDALASSVPDIAGDTIDERPLAIMAIWGAFGGFGLLAGTLLLVSGRRRARADAAAKAAPGAAPDGVAAWRTRIGETLGLLGLAVFVAAFAGGLFLDGSSERAVQFGLRCAGTSFLIWLGSGLLAGTMTTVAAAVMALLGGVLLFFAELMRHF
ncbi:MAG: hypothetical protein U1F56_24685 [Rubrivivax sp.]